MILVVAEQRDQALNRASWEAIAAAQQLAGGLPVKVLTLGASVAGVAQELAQADVAEILVGEHAALALYTPDAFTMALAGIITSIAPAFVLMPHTSREPDHRRHRHQRGRIRRDLHPADVPGQADRDRSAPLERTGDRDLPDWRIPGRCGPPGRPRANQPDRCRDRRERHSPTA